MRFREEPAHGTRLTTRSFTPRLPMTVVTLAELRDNDSRGVPRYSSPVETSSCSPDRDARGTLHCGMATLSSVFRWWDHPRKRPPVRGPLHSPWSAGLFLERTTGFEPATPPWQGCRDRPSDLRRHAHIVRDLRVCLRMQRGRFAPLPSRSRDPDGTPSAQCEPNRCTPQPLSSQSQHVDGRYFGPVNRPRGSRDKLSGFSFLHGEEGETDDSAGTDSRFLIRSTP
jgi:hypothetical protein